MASPIPLPPGRYVDLPGRGRTFVRTQAGPPGAPTVVLLHGWTATADLNWFPCYGPLARSYNVIALDHRGHGRGLRSSRPFRLEDCADDVAAAAEALGVSRLVPVGYSMGGPVAMLVWRRHRELVSGLVLCATSRNFGRSPRVQAFYSSLLGLSALTRLTPASARRRLMANLYSSSSDDSPLGRWVTEELGRNDPGALLQAGYALGQFDSAPWVGEIDVPTAVVATVQDSVVRPDRQLRLAESIPGATLHRVAADHGACVRRPDLFVPALLGACADVTRRHRATRSA